MVSEKKKKTVAEIRAEALKKDGLLIGPLSSVLDEVQALSTGNIAIDHITGIGGFPIGRSVEVFGPPSSSKTTVATMCAANLQKIIKNGGSAELGIKSTDFIVYFDYEQSMDKNYCAALGLDVDHSSFLLAQPESIEQGAERVREFIESGEVRLIIWDSVAAAQPDALRDREYTSSLPAAAAKAYAVFLGSLNEPLNRNRTTLIMINHISEVISIGGYSKPGVKVFTTPGGRALKFYSSVRLEFQQIGNVKGAVQDEITLEEEDIAIATNIRVKVVKNKVGPPFKQAKVRVRYGKGLDNFYTAMQILVAHKKVPYSAGYFYFDKTPALIHEDMAISGTGRPNVRGESNLYEFAEARSTWRDLAIKIATEVVSDDASVLDRITPVSVDIDDEELDADLLEGNKPVSDFTKNLLDDM